MASKKLSIGLIVLLIITIMVTNYLALNVHSRDLEASSDLTELQSGTVSATANDAPSCRYGAATLRSEQVDWLDDIGLGWHLNFHTDAGMEAPNGAEFVPLVYIRQDKQDATYLPTYTVSPPLNDEGLGQAIDLMPGALWIIGNEVDRGPNPGDPSSGQGDTFPAIYAEAYHEIYHYIKERDPTAQVANSGLVEVTPGRLQYLDLMWDSYLDQFGAPMPVDVWNMHIYVLSEVNPQGRPNNIASVAVGTDPVLAKKESYDPDGGGPLTPKDTCSREDVYCIAQHDDVVEFAEQVTQMRSWMNRHGQRHKPLILSEFSLLFPYEQDPGGTCWVQDEFGGCFTEDRVLRYMDNTLAYLTSARDESIGLPVDDNRLVQQWLWFSMNNKPGIAYISDLVALDEKTNSLVGLTAVGENYRDWARSTALLPNLIAAEPGVSIAYTQEPSGTTEVLLKVSIGNAGNIDLSEPFSVTFYADSDLTQIIGTVRITNNGANDSAIPLPGCGRKSIEIQMNWDGLGSGIHSYWVVVDSDHNIDESAEDDNLSSGQVIVNPDQLFLPLIRR